jgi:hypothetical protein
MEHLAGEIVRSVMKIANFILLCFLVGCAARPSLEQLEKEAMASGDWSAVEQREEAMRRYDPNNGGTCPAGQDRVCYENPAGENCRCRFHRDRPTLDELH